MNAVLSFNLPEDNDEFILATKGPDLHSAIWDIYQMLRNKNKYGEFKHTETHDVVEKIYEEFYDILQNNNVSTDMVS